MKFYDNTKYAFLLAIVRSYESKMLTAGEVERMISAKDAKEAYRVFNDLEYAKFLGDTERVEDFQEIINAGLVEIKEIITKNAPYKNLLDILWLRFDFTNLKALVKAKLQEKDFTTIEKMFLPYGKYTFEEMTALFAKEKEFGAKTDKIQNILEKTIQEALEIFEEKKDPILVDACLDQAYYDYLTSFLPEVKSKFVNEYYTLEIDLKNIRTYLRAIALEKTGIFDKLYLKGGSFLEEKFTGNFEEFLEKFKNTDYYELIQKAIEKYVKTKSFLEFEKASDAMLLEHMSKARYINLGIEPIFAFFWIKENNAQVLRTIMVNKLNGIETGEIRKKVRKLYK